MNIRTNLILFLAVGFLWLFVWSFQRLLPEHIVLNIVIGEIALLLSGIIGTMVILGIAASPKFSHNRLAQHLLIVAACMFMIESLYLIVTTLTITFS